MASKLSTLANEMTTNREGLSTTAWLMKKFVLISENLDSIKSVPNGLVILEAFNAQAKDLLATASIDTLEQNNFQLQETLTKAAAESPSLYQVYMDSLQKLRISANTLKDELSGKGGTQQKEPLITSYEKIAKDIQEIKKRKSISAEETKNEEKKIQQLIARIKDYLDRQEQIKQQQMQIAKNFTEAARGANLSVEPPTLS